MLIVGGGAGMPGALRLAGEAALRVGAGLVTRRGRAGEPRAGHRRAAPSSSIYPLPSTASLEAAMRAADVLAIGPGLGHGRLGAAPVGAGARRPAMPAVVDADALNLLALEPGQTAGRLDHHSASGRGRAVVRRAVTATCRRDRLGAARELHARYGAVAVLKGAGTLVASGASTASTEVFICERGNPGMATAGMGDVLTGVIAGLRAQIADSAAAARVGVLVHALAGDSAAQGGQRGLIASDVIAELRGWVNP